MKRVTLSSSDSSDSEQETLSILPCDDDITQLFASDGEAASFSGFSKAHDSPTRVGACNNNKESNHDNVGDDPIPSTSRGPGKGPGKNLKKKAPMKRKACIPLENAREKKLKQQNAEYKKLYSMLESLLESSAPLQPEAEENNTEPEHEELEVNLNELDIFGNSDDDNRALEQEFEFELPKIFDGDENFGPNTLDSIANLVNKVVIKKSNIADIANTASTETLIPAENLGLRWKALVF